MVKGYVSSTHLEFWIARFADVAFPILVMTSVLENRAAEQLALDRSGSRLHAPAYR
jgi:hypothetical protein